MLKHKNFIFVFNFQLRLLKIKKKLQITKFKGLLIKILKNHYQLQFNYNDTLRSQISSL